MRKKGIITYCLIFTISVTIAFLESLFKNKYHNENISRVFSLYLVFGFSSITVLYLVLIRLFGTKRIKDFSEQITNGFIHKSYTLLIIRVIGGAVVFGFLFGVAQIIVSQFHTKGHRPYLILNSVLIGIAGGVGLFFLASLKNHQHNIATTFLSGFLGFGGGHYITSQLYIINIYYSHPPVPYWRILDTVSLILSGALAGLSFGVLQKKFKWAFSFTLTGIIGIYLDRFLASKTIEVSAYQLLVAFRPFDEYLLGEFMGRHMFVSFLLGKILFGITMGFLFGFLVDLSERVDAQPNPALS